MGSLTYITYYMSSVLQWCISVDISNVDGGFVPSMGPIILENMTNSELTVFAQYVIEVKLKSLLCMKIRQRSRLRYTPHTLCVFGVGEARRSPLDAGRRPRSHAMSGRRGRGQKSEVFHRGLPPSSLKFIDSTTPCNSRRHFGHLGIKIVTIRRKMTKLRQFEYLGPATWRTIFRNMFNFQRVTI